MLACLTEDNCFRIPVLAQRSHTGREVMVVHTRRRSEFAVITNIEAGVMIERMFIFQFQSNMMCLQ